MSEQKWKDGITVMLGATYRQKSTGVLMRLQSADSAENQLILSPPVQKWQGTSQQFDESFELVEAYKKPIDNPALRD